MLNGENSNKNWRVVVADIVRKQLKRIPAQDAKRILRAIDLFEENPWSEDTDKLEGEEISWRRRVGNYRILFDILSTKRVVFIYEVKRAHQQHLLR